MSFGVVVTLIAATVNVGASILLIRIARSYRKQFQDQKTLIDRQAQILKDLTEDHLKVLELLGVSLASGELDHALVAYITEHLPHAIKLTIATMPSSAQKH